MKFNEDILNNFNLESTTPKEAINVMQVADMLTHLQYCAERIAQKSDIYVKMNDAEIQMDCIDIVTAKLNEFAQVFRDLVIFMRKDEGTHRSGVSLRYSITSFDTFGFTQTEEEKMFLRELLLRNEITHDYFNIEMHRQKLMWIMINCGRGALDVHRDLKTYCESHHLLYKYVNKNCL